MIEATETQVQGDHFDFLRTIDDEVLAVAGSDERNPGADLSLNSIHSFDTVIQSDTQIKEKA